VVVDPDWAFAGAFVPPSSDGSFGVPAYTVLNRELEVAIAPVSGRGIVDESLLDSLLDDPIPSVDWPLSGCGSDPDPNDDDSAGDDDNSAGDDDDDDSSFVGGLSGTVTRSIDPVEGQDGIGDLYVTVFDEPPGSSGVSIVGQFVLIGADFSAAGATVTYELPALAVRKDPYFMEAFLDDDESSPVGGPDVNDLLSDLYSVVVESTDLVVQDLDLGYEGTPGP